MSSKWTRQKEIMLPSFFKFFFDSRKVFFTELKRQKSLCQQKLKESLLNPHPEDKHISSRKRYRTVIKQSRVSSSNYLDKTGKFFCLNIFPEFRLRGFLILTNNSEMPSGNIQNSVTNFFGRIKNSFSSTIETNLQSFSFTFAMMSFPFSIF